jgi:hypothetical protein
MQNKLVSLYQCLFLIFLIGFSGSAYAEYYIVSSEAPCGGCTVQPHYAHYSGGCHHRYHRHHYSRHRQRSTLSMRVYNVYNVFPTSACENPCGCARPTCSPCQREVVTRCYNSAPHGHFVSTEQPNDFNYDMRTMDDDREY